MSSVTFAVHDVDITSVDARIRQFVDFVCVDIKFGADTSNTVTLYINDVIEGERVPFDELVERVKEQFPFAKFVDCREPVRI